MTVDALAARVRSVGGGITGGAGDDWDGVLLAAALLVDEAVRGDLLWGEGGGGIAALLWGEGCGGMAALLWGEGCGGDHDGEQYQDREGRIPEACLHGGVEGVLLVTALVGEAVCDFLVGSGHDGGRGVPHVLENVRVDALTVSDGVLGGDLDVVRLRQIK